MERNDFRVSSEIVWILAICDALLTIIGVIFKIQHIEYSQLLLTIWLLLLFSTWIIIVNDMIISSIYNKTFWIMSIFILPSITPIFYLIQRNKLIRLGKKLSNN